MTADRIGVFNPENVYAATPATPPDARDARSEVARGTRDSSPARPGKTVRFVLPRRSPSFSSTNKVETVSATDAVAATFCAAGVTTISNTSGVATPAFCFSPMRTVQDGSKVDSACIPPAPAPAGAARLTTNRGIEPVTVDGPLCNQPAPELAASSRALTTAASAVAGIVAEPPPLRIIAPLFGR